MAGFEYDLLVIGAGSGGVRAARVSAGYGAKVAIAEDHRVGGTCVIRGCVPKKLLVYAAHVREEIEDAGGYGWRIADARFDWPQLIANKDREIARLEAVYRELLSISKVALIEGRARLLDPHTAEIAGRRVTAQKILIANGAHPVRPEGFTSENSITSN
jgi:glutathione reductase (NADPH)